MMDIFYRSQLLIFCLFAYARSESYSINKV